MQKISEKRDVDQSKESKEETKITFQLVKHSRNNGEFIPRLIQKSSLSQYVNFHSKSAKSQGSPSLPKFH